MSEYIPSAADGPNGPRNNKDQLDDIERNTASFANQTDPAVEIDDPFHKDNVGAFILITNMRIYDATMALLNEKDPDAATKLHELHAQGKILGSFPWLDPEAEG